MAAVHRICCTECGFVTRFYDEYTRREYLFENGLRIEVPVQLAWCSTCSKAVDGEAIPDAQEAEKFIDTITSTSGIEAEKGERPTGEDAGLLEHALREWLTKRKSPPRCLECGSNTILFPDALNMINQGCPKCGKNLHVSCSGWATVELPDKKYFYSPEGLLLDVQPIDLDANSIHAKDELLGSEKSPMATRKWWRRFFRRRS